MRIFLRTSHTGGDGTNITLKTDPLPTLLDVQNSPLRLDAIKAGRVCQTIYIHINESV
jgi:hypothetical protein